MDSFVLLLLMTLLLMLVMVTVTRRVVNTLLFSIVQQLVNALRRHARVEARCNR